MPVPAGNDARYHSAEFARITAAVFVEAGVRVHLFPDVGTCVGVALR